MSSCAAAPQKLATAQNRYNLRDLHNHVAPAYPFSGLCFTKRVDTYMKESKIVGLLSESKPDGWDEASSVIGLGHPGYIVVLQGATSSASLRDVVNQCDADDKLVQLHFPSSAVFPTGKLLSRTKRFATIRFITIGSFIQSRETNIDDRVRSRVNTELIEHHRQCLAGDRDGFECFRAIDMLGRSFFTVEQQASFFVYRVAEKTAGGAADAETGCWSGVLLSDIGKPSAMPPWNTSRRDFSEARFLSIESCDSNLARFDNGSESPQVMTQPNPFESRRLGYKAMSPEDQELCVTEPFVFAADLFETSALCWDQVLNFLRDAVQNHLPDDATERIELLGQVKGLVSRASRYFDETIRFIDGRGDIGWPISDRRVEEIANRLQSDFDALYRDAAALSAECQDSIYVTMNNISVHASQQSLDQGIRTKWVTYLAFLFIPISLVSSCFGMNVAELDPPVPITRFITSAVLISAICLGLPIWLIEFRGAAKLYRCLQSLRDWRC